MFEKIYLKNTLSGKIEKFKPINRGHIGMYNCGPTVYNEAHVGNLSSYVRADILSRLFKARGCKVNQVINITDVGHLTDDSDSGDDKIEKESKKTGDTASSIAKKYTDIFLNDLAALNIPINEITFPKATDNIEEQIDLIKKLEAKSLTYQTSDGVYYNTVKFKNYGKLGNINVDNLMEGARVEQNIDKKNPTDFALWKFSKPGENRQQEWPSPWGVGFPGWHIECSAMSRKYLGETFDIHTGGIDHIPTHHNNEIAQSEAAYDKPLANYWIHFNHIMYNGEKFAKSTGNVVYLSQIIEKSLAPGVLRYWLLTSHYSTPSNFTWETLESTKKAYDKISRLVTQNKPTKYSKKYYKKALREVSHDLGTPEAIAVIWEVYKDDNLSDGKKSATILKIDELLGINFLSSSQSADEIPSEVIELAKKRQEARAENNFAEADKLRNEISSRGYQIKDSSDDFELEKLS
jgi:cysteinyl-tRNA synthetase